MSCILEITPYKWTLSLVFINCKIAGIGLRQSDCVKEDCSTSKLVCFSLIVENVITNVM